MKMKSKVFFTAVSDSDSVEVINGKLKKLLEQSFLLDFIKKDEKVAVKVHFGEEGNTHFIRPVHVGAVCRQIAAKGALPFLSDANTLYRGQRLNAKDHGALALKHGFTREATGADVIIPDDRNKEESANVALDGKWIKTAKVGRLYLETPAMVVVSHFKGHILTGFGGALKNVGMGCATREGKLAQHCDFAPVVHVEQCAGCGECSVVCPVKAVAIENNKAVIDEKRCIGCASCVEACPTLAMFIDFGAGDKVQEKVCEYSLAVLKDKKGKAGFINFALNISKECDCWNQENPLIAPNVGILASLDPVSIDHASFDVVTQHCGRDIFQENHPGKDGMKQLKYAQQIGLGNIDYELVSC